jgi:hypothetical protein
MTLPTLPTKPWMQTCGLRYATRTTLGWEVEAQLPLATITNPICGSGGAAKSAKPASFSGDQCHALSLAIDSSGAPHIAYHTADWDVETYTEPVVYAHREGSVWHTECVGSRFYDGEPFVSVASGGGGDACVVWVDDNLRSAAHTDAGWGYATVAGVGSAGVGAMLRLDGEDIPHIAYALRDLGGGGGTEGWLCRDPPRAGAAVASPVAHPPVQA